ncbi:MAG: cation-translocating P-type ATPase [Firmicutes bacterium]|nr:cation-translocating P-type ATPase [Bacillota bacterium]
MEKLTGLTSQEAKQKQLTYGKNELTAEKKGFFKKVLAIFVEPMFILLLAAATIYFIFGEMVDGTVMLIFVVFMISIEAFQSRKADKTLAALKDLSAPNIKVIRDGEEKMILTADLVPADLMLISEGVRVPADGFVVRANDLCMDESSLTGETEGVWKREQDIILNDLGGNFPGTAPHGDASDDYWKKDYVYAGTSVLQGGAYILVDKIGGQTEHGKIGKDVAEAKPKRSPLQKQTGNLIKLCAGIAAILFALVGVITYFNISDHATGERITESILSGIALAMAMIPEEFPVILTVFLSMGAWRLAKKQALVRKMPAIETLGAVSVLCVDKTGTITKNQMTVAKVVSGRWSDIVHNETRLLKVMGMACEVDAYDPMEKAMLAYCEQQGLMKEELFAGRLIKEYPFTNELKVMGHVWQNDDEMIVCVKGSPEKVLELCNLSESQKIQAGIRITALSQDGLRVIAVAEALLGEDEEIPYDILSCRLKLLGFVGLYDPPRDTVAKDIEQCVRAKIRVVMITGDNGITACSIARQVGIQGCDEVVTGNQLSAMTDDELKECVKSVNIFSRVLPEHKTRVVKAFQNNGEIVAMTGDGVNDAPALKHADIGIAMGKRGSDVSREAADMILTDDNFSTIVNTVKDGRRIYQNIKKAVGYVFTIHIPIALSVLLAPLLGISPADLMLLPIQIMLLELMIDPTCSIVLERQPPEKDIMKQKPRNPKEKLITPRLMIKSVTQGLAIFAAAFFSYYFMLQGGESAEKARTMAVAVLIFANLFLVLVNSSQKDSIFKTLKALRKDRATWIANVLTLAILIIIVYTPLNTFLKLSLLSAAQFFIALGLGAICVLWYEIVKFAKRLKKKI